MTKSDCWDSRFESDHQAETLPHDELIRLEKEYGFSWPTPVECDAPRPTWRENPENIQVNYASSSFGDYLHGPNPKPMGTFIVRHNGLYGMKLSGKLEIATGELSVCCDFGEGVLTVSAFVDRKTNVLYVRTAAGEQFRKLIVFWKNIRIIATRPFRCLSMKKRMSIMHRCTR